MARANEKIVQVLRTTADRIVNSPNYQWGHMGACNCGHLAQVITARSKAEIHQFAMQNEAGDWNDQLNDYCGTGNRPFDEIIAEMLDIGFDSEDLQHLERLSDRRILARLPEELKGATLQHNVREDVSLYLTLWADMVADSIEEQDERMKKLAHEPTDLWDSFDEEEKEDFVFGAMVMETNKENTVDTETFKRELRTQIGQFA